ncbi:MAG TPA: HAD family hydrolase [Solirubrobacteraceae bacterium]|jgi:HAD superfamily hydrolase (TIGR01509 family)|nr:HAD family hydrolase [Solirubrobacteraceae bacterium]
MNRVVILDVDGTLVDTNYQHALAWYRAFRDNELVLPIWRIHRHIGMGGDQLVADLTDEGVEARIGEQIRKSETHHYAAMMGEVEAFDGARELLHQLHDNGYKFILASSAKPEEIEYYIDLLDARAIADGWTSAGDVESTKPAPDLVKSALARAGARADEATMVGDSPWDARSAGQAGVETIAVMTGGFSEQELRDAGAVDVYESVRGLNQALG